MQVRDLSFDFADHVLASTYARLPPDAIDRAKKSVLDAMGNISAASGMEPAVRNVIDLVKESGGRPEASILAFGGRVPAAMAAFANGAMAHCLDYDDQTPWGQHAGSSLLPAVFAIAERRGHVSGKELITAVAIGQDLFNRMRLHANWRKDWNFSMVVGLLSATASCVHLLRLSRDQVVNAFCVASMQCGGTMNVIHGVGGDLRAMYACFPAKAAVISALLASRGVTGVPAIFEGEHGIMQMYFDNDYDRGRLVEGLGVHYAGEATLFKRWPTVGTAHSHLHATIEIVTEHDLRVDDIAQIRVFAGDYHQLMCTPLAARRAPTTLVDARFSLPYLVAVAARERDVRLKDFTETALRDPVVLSLAARVIPVPDSSLDWTLVMPPGRVEIITRDGQRFEKTGIGVPGSEAAPLTWHQLAGKFEDCMAASTRPLSVARQQEVLASVNRLEEIGDVAVLLRIVAGDG